MAAVQNAVQNGIENLSGTSIAMNAHPDDGYRYRARTREELLASQALVANAGTVSAGREAQDPAAAFESSSPPSPPPKQQGWIL